MISCNTLIFESLKKVTKLNWAPLMVKRQETLTCSIGLFLPQETVTQENRKLISSSHLIVHTKLNFLMRIRFQNCEIHSLPSRLSVMYKPPGIVPPLRLNCRQCSFLTITTYICFIFVILAVHNCLQRNAFEEHRNIVVD